MMIVVSNNDLQIGSGVNLIRSLGGRESGRRNFRFQPKKFPILPHFPEKCPIFQAKNSDDLFLVVNSKILVSPKIFKFSLFTPTFFASLSLFLRKRRFLTYFLCKIDYSVFREPFTTTLRPTAIPTIPRIHSFNHSGHFYSAPPSPLPSEALPTTARILYRSFTPKLTCNCR